MDKILGTLGYSTKIQAFIKATLDIPFEVLHKDFMKFFPNKKSNILDLGAGIGRDAYELAKRGHTVVAVEPLNEFRTAGKELFKDQTIYWIDDALPHLRTLQKLNLKFDFILVSGVWHHLNEQEQGIALKLADNLLLEKGKLALSLRNGPSGVGLHTFPTEGLKIQHWAENLGLKTLLHLKNQSSLMKNKSKVKWSRLVFEKST